MNAIRSLAFTMGSGNCMKGRITKRLVDETFGDNKPVFVFDTELAGFVLKVTPSGRKTYQFGSVLLACSSTR